MARRLLLVGCSLAVIIRGSGSTAAVPIQLISLLDSPLLLFRFLVLIHPPHPATLGPQLDFIRGLDAPDTRSIYSKLGHLIHHEVPRTKIKTGIKVGSLVRKGKIAPVPPATL